jgi:hypothetical protein
VSLILNLHLASTSRTPYAVLVRLLLGGQETRMYSTRLVLPSNLQTPILLESSVTDSLGEVEPKSL